MSIHQNSVKDFHPQPRSMGPEANCPACEGSDAELQQLASGDSDAFWRLWEEHEEYLYRICLHQLDGIQEEAEDALSILMVKLLDLLPRYADRIQNLRAWLTRITYNLCIDIHREIKRSKTVASIDDLAETNHIALLSSMESPEDAALRLESRQHIFSAIDDLSTNLRVPFLLHHLYEWSYTEIAAQLAISPENARKRGQLARVVLRERLEEYLNGGTTRLASKTPIDLDAYLRPFSLTPPEQSPQVVVRFVNVVLSSGIERSFCIHLDHRQQKLYPKIQQALRYTSNHPGGWKKRLELAQLLFEAGEWREAIQEYQRVLEKQPRLLPAYLDLGAVLGLMENKADSIATYEKALEVVQEPASRHHLKGMIAMMRGLYRTAIAEFEEAARIEPNKTERWHSLAMAHSLTDSPIAALGSFKESLKIDPKDLRALTYLPGVLYDLGRVGEAVRYADKSMNLHAENVPALKSLADYRSRRRMVFGDEGRKTKGLIKDALRFAAQSPEAHESLSWFHLCRGEWTEGVAVLRRFAEQHRSNPEAWCDYARAQFRIGDTFSAAGAIRRALTLDPDSHKVNSTACEVLSQLGPSPELRTLLEGMLLKFPERWTTWTKVGLALITVFGEDEPACAIAERGPRLQPQLPHAWFQQSQVLALAAKYQEAIMSAEIGWRWLPEDEDGLLSVPAACRLAENCLLINDRTRGEFWIAEASQRLAGLIGFDPANGYWWEGKLFELAGDRSGALASFTRAVDHHLFYPARREVEAAITRLTSPLSRSARRFPVG